MNTPTTPRPLLRLAAIPLALFCLSAPVPSALADPKAMEPGSEELYRLQDAALNSTYQRILRAYADDPAFIAKLKASQRAWITFRDAELEALFPEADKLGYYGSVWPQARRHWLGKLTEERTVQLSRWLEGAEEGDVFAGSIKTKPVEEPSAPRKGRP